VRPTKPSDMPVVVMTRRVEGYRHDQPKLYSRMVEQFKDMAKGGSGGPHLYGYKWTTVRKAYFEKWTDDMFTKVLINLGEDS